MRTFFRLKENGTNVRTEIMAGLTTFMTMAYILAVNPGILGGAGLNAVFSFSCDGARRRYLSRLRWDLFVNFPVALAPGMGLNAYFAATVLASKATNHPISPEMALTAVFISGIIFLDFDGHTNPSVADYGCSGQPEACDYSRYWSVYYDYRFEEQRLDDGWDRECGNRYP